MSKEGNVLNSKIDFVVVVDVEMANPNGDPNNGNMPRTIDGTETGLITDVCIKHKIRESLLSSGNEVFCLDQEDGHATLKSRYEATIGELGKKKKGKDKNPNQQKEISAILNDKFIDVRAFGAVNAFSGSDSESTHIRGCVSIGMAKSISPIKIQSISITKSVDGSEPKEGSNKASDTMGTKYLVVKGRYVLKGSIYPQLAKKNGFTNEDANKVKEAIKNMFDEDMSSARPSGSMQVAKLVWINHGVKNGKISSGDVFDSIKVTDDSITSERSLGDGVQVELL